jgi:hypothetical protein
MNMKRIPMTDLTDSLNNGPLAAALQLRLPEAMLAAIEDWRRARARIPCRAVAIRELLTFALAAQQPPAPAE